jgi:hypothetical protein
VCCDHGLPGGGVARLEHYRVYSYRALHQADCVCDSSKLIIQALIIGSRTPHTRVRRQLTSEAARGPGARPARRPGSHPTGPSSHRCHITTVSTGRPRPLRYIPVNRTPQRMPVSLLLCLTPPRLLSLSSFLSSPRGNPFRHPCPRFSASLRSGPPSINLLIRRHEAPSGAIRHHRAHHLSASAPLKDPSARASIARVSHRSPSISRAEASPLAAGRHPSA